MTYEALKSCYRRVSQLGCDSWRLQDGWRFAYQLTESGEGGLEWIDTMGLI